MTDLKWPASFDRVNNHQTMVPHSVMASQIDAAVNAAVAAERERCAKIAESEVVDAEATGEETDRCYNQACADIAAAIRRGE